jgi:hypothetical protein
MHKNNVLLLNLTAVSFFCLIVLAGLYRYSGGSILPAINNAGPGEALSIWVMWSLIVGVPAMTAALWMIRLWSKRDR